MCMLALVWLGLGCFSYVVAEEVWLAYVLGAPDQGCPRSRVLYRGKEYVMLDLKSDFWRLHKFFTSS